MSNIFGQDLTSWKCNKCSSNKSHQECSKVVEKLHNTMTAMAKTADESRESVLEFEKVRVAASYQV